MLLLFKLSVLLSFVALVASRTHITGCLDDGKECVGLPRGCIGTACFVAFSSTSNGTHTEIEIFGNDILDKTWLAIAYSADKEMGDDFVFFCIRDDKETDVHDIEQMGGLAYNSNVEKRNEMIGTISSMKNTKKDKFGFDLDISEYNKDDKTLYCKMTHRIDPIIKQFNMTQVEILMSKGVWIKNAISYHGKTRNNVGIVDLSGQKKKKNSSAGSLALLSSAITFIAAKMFF